MPRLNITREHAALHTALAALGSPIRAEGEKRYLKSPWKFMGVPQPVRHRLARQWLRDHAPIQPAEVKAFAAHLWQSEWHEEKTLAIFLLACIPRSLTSRDLPAVEQMLQEVTGWDHLDDLAAHVISPMIDNDPKVLRRLPLWARSRRFWVRRAALLAQLIQIRRREADLDLLFRLIVPMLDEGTNWDATERFFIRKAIGWVLREIAKVQPGITRDFVRKHVHALSGLSFREATRKLPPAMRKELETLRAAGTHGTALTAAAATSRFPA